MRQSGATAGRSRRAARPVGDAARYRSTLTWVRDSSGAKQRTRVPSPNALEADVEQVFAA